MYRQLFTCTLLSVILISCSENKAETVKEKETPRETKLEWALIEKGELQAVVKLPGQLAAFKEVSIFPKVNGYVKTVNVDLGTKVAEGARLMVIEAPELQQAAAAASERYAKAKADFMTDREKFIRLTVAAKTEGAISPMELSSARLKMEADSAICNAELANWNMQKVMLDYLTVTAPFSGVITQRTVHPGTLVNAAVKDKPMLELKQLSVLRLQVDVPENLSVNQKVNDSVHFTVNAVPGELFSGRISRKSNNIDPKFRSERIEIDVPNPGGQLSPGMYAELTFRLTGSRSSLLVPQKAVITSTERKYIVLWKNGGKVKIDVSTGLKSADKVQVYGTLQAGDSVLVNASDDL